MTLDYVPVMVPALKPYIPDLKDDIQVNLDEDIAANLVFIVHKNETFHRPEDKENVAQCLCCHSNI